MASNFKAGGKTYRTISKNVGGKVTVTKYGQERLASARRGGVSSSGLTEQQKSRASSLTEAAQMKEYGRVVVPQTESIAVTRAREGGGTITVTKGGLVTEKSESGRTIRQFQTTPEASRSFVSKQSKIIGAAVAQTEKSKMVPGGPVSLDQRLPKPGAESIGTFIGRLKEEAPGPTTPLTMAERVGIGLPPVKEIPKKYEGIIGEGTRGRIKEAFRKTTLENVEKQLIEEIQTTKPIGFQPLKVIKIGALGFTAGIGEIFRGVGKVTKKGGELSGIEAIEEIGKRVEAKPFKSEFILGGTILGGGLIAKGAGLSVTGTGSLIGKITTKKRIIRLAQIGVATGYGFATKGALALEKKPLESLFLSRETKEFLKESGLRKTIEEEILPGARKVQPIRNIPESAGIYKRFIAPSISTGIEFVFPTLKEKKSFEEYVLGEAEKRNINPIKTLEAAKGIERAESAIFTQQIIAPEIIANVMGGISPTRFTAGVQESSVGFSAILDRFKTIDIPFTGGTFKLGEGIKPIRKEGGTTIIGESISLPVVGVFGGLTAYGFRSFEKFMKPKLGGKVISDIAGYGLDFPEEFVGDVLTVGASGRTMTFTPAISAALTTTKTDITLPSITTLGTYDISTSVLPSTTKIKTTINEYVGTLPQSKDFSFISTKKVSSLSGGKTTVGAKGETLTDIGVTSPYTDVFTGTESTTFEEAYTEPYTEPFTSSFLPSTTKTTPFTDTFVFTPDIPIIPLPSGGGGFSLFGGARRRPRRITQFTPSIYGLITGKGAKKGQLLTGLEPRALSRISKTPKMIGIGKTKTRKYNIPITRVAKKTKKNRKGKLKIRF